MNMNSRGPDTFTKVTTQSYGQKIGASFKGILAGAAMFVVAFPVLFNNESRAVREANALADGRGAAVSIQAGAVDPANEGKLVHLSGRAATDEVLRDPLFDVSAQGLHLKRSVEYLQWKESSRSESQDKLGGSTETTTTYTYTKEWVDEPVDSSAFAQPAGHQNTVIAKLDDERWSASNVTLGAFKLNQDQVRGIGEYKPHPLPADVTVPVSMGVSTTSGNVLYLGTGANGSDPPVGSVRITYTFAPATDATVIARQYGDSFLPFETRSGGTVSLIENGTLSIDQMFTAAESRNKVITWALRLLGLFLLCTGLSMILRPLSVFASVVPFLGKIVGAGTSVIAWAIGLTLGLVTIAIAWLAARPVLGFAVLALAAGGAVFAFMKIRKAPAPEAAAATQAA